MAFGSCLAISLLSLVFLSCGGGGSTRLPPPIATATRSPALAEPATPPRGSPAPPAITLEPVPPDTVWLFDVRNGARTTLVESAGQSVLRAGFGPEETVFVHTLVVDRVGGNRVEQLQLRYDGSLAARGTPVPSPAAAPGECSQSPDGAVVRGRVYRDVNCGLVSPDGRWMTYQVGAGMNQLATPSPDNPGGFSVPVWDQWAVELATDQRRLLHAGLVHCGGCDGRFGPAWSASGRLLYFSEWSDPGSTFVSDLQTGITRELSFGTTDIAGEPDWSPRSDVLVYRTTAGGTVLEDFGSSVRRDLPELAWPARFDPSGALLYSPAWDNDPAVAGGETVIYDLRTGRVISRLGGLPRFDSPFTPYAANSVLGADGSFIAVLEGSAECSGVAIYRGNIGVACVGGGSDAALSADGRLVALARLTRAAAPGGPAQMNEYEVMLVEVATGSASVLATGARGALRAPELIWNDASTHLLVRWPFSGYGP